MLALLAVQASVAYATAGTWLPGVSAALPANAGANPFVSLTRISCPSPGNCTAVGTYDDTSGNQQGVLLSESSGTWATGVEAALPASAGANPTVFLNDVACPSAGNCTAVGSYVDTSGDQQGLLLNENSGVWAPVEAIAPSNAGPNPAISVDSVSCPSVGNCTAVGSFVDNLGNLEGVRLDESSGNWTQGVVPALPANFKSTPDDSLSSVSCPSAGNCTTVGSYFDSSDDWQAELWSQSSGTWAGTATEGVLPAGARTEPVVSMASVSCASAGNCGAVGSYIDSSVNQQGLLLTQSSGTWAPGVEAGLPADAATNPLAVPTAVSCGADGSCSAVGYYFDGSNHFHAVQWNQSGGTWASGTAPALPANANSSLIGDLRSVSCPSSGNCAAVGNYFDSSGLFQGMMFSESSGTWSTGIEATLPAGASSNPDVVLTSVSCSDATDCSAVGTYLDSSGNSQGLLLTDPPTNSVQASPPAEQATASPPTLPPAEQATASAPTLSAAPDTQPLAVQAALPAATATPSQPTPSAAPATQPLAVQAALPAATPQATRPDAARHPVRQVKRTARRGCTRSSRHSRHDCRASDRRRDSTHGR